MDYRHTRLDLSNLLDLGHESSDLKKRSSREEAKIDQDHGELWASRSGMPSVKKQNTLRTMKLLPEISKTSDVRRFNAHEFASTGFEYLVAGQWARAVEWTGGGLVALRKIQGGQESRQQASALSRLKHDNLDTFHGVYMDKSDHYVVFDYMPVTLAKLIDSDVRLSSLEFCAIVKQICAGLLFLDQHGFGLKSLTCADIFISNAGVVKIGTMTLLHASPSTEAVSIHDIILGLLANAVDDEHNLQVLDFLKTTKDETNVHTLLEHPLFGIARPETRLGIIVETVRLTVSIVTRVFEE